jgi:hypothetical protein
MMVIGNFKGLLAGIGVLALMTGTTMALEWDTNVLNGQINLSDQYSHLNVVSGNSGELRADNVALGNSLTVDVDSDLYLDTTQTQEGDLSAYSNVEANDLWGNVYSSTAAMANSVSLVSDLNDETHIVNEQTANSEKSVWADVSANGVGHVNLNAVTMGNGLTIDSDSWDLRVDNRQTNSGAGNAGINANINNALNTSVTAASIGNSATIINRGR